MVLVGGTSFEKNSLRALQIEANRSNHFHSGSPNIFSLHFKTFSIHIVHNVINQDHIFLHASQVVKCAADLCVGLAIRQRSFETYHIT